MIKNFILDTNVLVHDPTCFHKFEDNNLIIPFPVLDEIDRLKSKPGTPGQSAREINRFLDALRKKGDLTKGVDLESGSNLRVLVYDDFKEELPAFINRSYTDNMILLYALELKNREKEIPVYLITKDINLRVKADSLEIPAQDYLADRVDIDIKTVGLNRIDDEEVQKEYVNTGKISIDRLELENCPNSFVDFGNDVYGRVTPDCKEVIPLKISMKTSCWGIFARNHEQMMAMELLMDDSIKLVTIPGMAGTGKTLISLACALRKVVDERKYERLLVARPVVPMGQDIGYLPGDMEVKIRPWMEPIFDNLHLLFSNRHMDLETFLNRGDQLEVEVLSYIRGRSIPNQFIIIDEAQNLTPHEVKTIITRAGENTKIVLTGDPGQIDNAYLDAYSCGLIYAGSRFVNNPLAGQITLTKGERSELASAAAELL